MSSFICNNCKTEIIDTPEGYITGCEHWPMEKLDDKCDGTKFTIDRNGYWEILPECDCKPDTCNFSRQRSLKKRKDIKVYNALDNPKLIKKLYKKTLPILDNWTDEIVCDYCYEYENKCVRCEDNCLFIQILLDEKENETILKMIEKLEGVHLTMAQINPLPATGILASIAVMKEYIKPLQHENKDSKKRNN